MRTHRTEAFVSAARALLVLDFRLSSALIGLAVAYVLTFYFAERGLNESPPAFWFAFYAAWISGLLLFSVVGLVMGIISLYRPEQDVFAARVKILVGGKSGRAVEHLEKELKRIGWTAREMKRVVTITEYDKERDAFKITINHRGALENIYHDVATQANGHLHVLPDAFEPPFEELGRVVSFRVGSNAFPEIPVIIEKGGYKKEWLETIREGGELDIEYEYILWFKASELHEFTPSRFTSTLSTKFLARCTPDGNRLKLVTIIDGVQFERELRYDESYDLPPMRDRPPGECAYRFRLGVSS